MKIAVIVLADTETHAELARAVNALVTVREAREAGDDVRLIFDGAGTRWVGELARPEHPSHALYESVEDRITGACKYCAKAFEATEDIRAAGVPLLDDYRQHPSIRSLAHDGFDILIF